MAHRKQVPSPVPVPSARRSFKPLAKATCTVAAPAIPAPWRARKPQQVPPTSLAALPSASAVAPIPATPAAVSVALSKQSVGTIVVGTVVGNALTALLADVFARPAKPAPRPQAFPTWPPAELLAAAGAPVWVEDPAWTGRRWLTPTTHHGHTLYLYAEAGLPFVLWQLSSGEWRLLTTPADLAQLAQQRPVAPGMRALMRQHGVAIEPILVGLPLFDAFR